MISIGFALALMLLINAVLAMEKDNVSFKNPSEVANLSVEQSADQYNVTGLWKMIEGETSQYALELRQSGNAITGNIAHVSGLEPIDPISGFISPDGRMIFNRTRVGFSPHVYVGIISSSGDSLVMQGNCTYGGAFQYHWIATKANESENLKAQDILAAIDASPKFGHVKGHCRVPNVWHLYTPRFPLNLACRIKIVLHSRQEQV